jgi:hypothetical protein
VLLSSVLALACASPATPSEGEGEGSTDTASASEDSEADSASANFVPDGDESGETGTGPVDSHDEDILPYWTYNCVVYCHGNGAEGPAGGLNLEYDAAYDSLVGVPATQVDMLLVAPGSPEDSYLWHKLRGTHLEVGGSGEQMPLGAVPLDAEAMTRIETWIMIGAPP